MSWKQMSSCLGLAGIIVAAAAATASAQTIDGDWQGTIMGGLMEVRVVLHVAPDAKGGFTATFDSPDQATKGLAATAISFADSTLRFDVPRLGAAYEGKVDAKAATIAGTWTQGGGSAPLNLSRPPTASTVPRIPKPSDIDGNWEGTISAGGAGLRTVIHIQTFADGMAATMDSPDQNAFGLPISSITRDGKTLHFEMKQLGGSFSGTLDANLTTVDGNWSQLGNTLPLQLKRAR